MSRLNLLRLQRLNFNSVRFWSPSYHDKTVPVTFENVVFPPNGEMKLPVMPTEPKYDPELGEEKYKTTKRLIEARGVEPIHTTLIHKQYGLAAVQGGFLRPTDFKFLQTRINKNLQKNQFAIWRVPPPWLPRTRKPQGTKLGGGKGQLHHYVTPVRAERIIVELGGHITEIEAMAYVTYMTDFLPFPVRFVSEEMLAAERQYEEDVKKYNKNPFNWEKLIKWNMQNCTSFLNQYDIIWKGKPLGMATEDELIRIPFKKVVYYISGLPFLGLAFCVIYSFLFHFEDANATHCGVPNWLPSISAAVAKLEPERYVWRIAIGLHSAPRIVLAVAFRNFLVISPLRSLNTTFLNVMANIGCFFHIAEITFLMMLSAISSGDNYALHKLSFIGFLICGFIYMLMSIFLFDYSGRRRTVSVGEKSYQYKVFCCGAAFISLFFALYFFYRHNTYCEPGIYTFFALSEYGVVIFNILFHSTLYYDFYDRNFSIISGGFSASSYQMLPMHRDD